MKYRVNFRKEDGMVRVRVMGENGKAMDTLYLESLEATAPSKTYAKGHNFYIDYEGELELSNDGLKGNIS